MSKEKATTKQTGGGGFTFADKVAAMFMAKMLRRDLSLGVNQGPIIAVDFETSESGNPLDDLQISFQHEAQETRLFLSVKSNRQLTKAGFNREFVLDAWEQWSTRNTRRAFDPEHDLLGLTVGPVEDLALDEWKTLQGQIIGTTPGRILDRLLPEGQSNATQRDIFESLRTTEAAEKREPVDTARLAARIRLFPFSGKEEGESINLCAQIVASGSLVDAESLWDALLTVASESRGNGAHIDLPRLLHELRPRFELRDYPDYEADWKKLETISKENIESETRNSLGGGIHLPRDGARTRLVEELERNTITVIAGESGSGKSALVAEVVTTGNLYCRTLWITAGQFAKPSQVELAKSLNLRHPVPELITGSTVRNSVLVIDGLEQFEEDARKNVIRWIKEVHAQGFENWKVVITCQQQTIDAARDLLLEAGVTAYAQIDFEKPKLHEILAAVQSVPSLLPLLMRKELEPILCNLMVLDWVIRAEVAQRIPIAQPWIGETEIIDIIWTKWIGTDAKKHARDHFLRALGQKEGERMFGSLSIDSFEDRLEVAGELELRGLVRTDQGTIRFFHDLMGDWARYRKLKFAGGELVSEIAAVAKIPRWGRGIRLYAQSLAEKGTGLGDWKALSTQLSTENPETQLAADLLLDALLFAPNSEMLLEQVWSDLVADKVQILKRMLQRLLHVASVPDWRFQGIGDKDLAESAENVFRIPHPLFWYPALRVLRRHAQEIARLLPRLVAEVCALWLRTMPQGAIGRNEAGAVAVEIAKEIQGRIADGLRLEKKSQVIFEALLYAAPDQAEVAQIALELSGRLPEPAYASERAMEFQEERESRSQEWKKKKTNHDAVRRVSVSGFTYRQTRVIPPEPDGPRREIAVPFRAAVLNSAALTGLMSSQPEVAREILLAVSIHEPDENASYSELDRIRGEELGLSDWSEGNPALPWKGGFLRFLETAPEQGIDTIVRLVNYATSNWLESVVGLNPTEKQRKDWSLHLEVEGRDIDWTGDVNVFGWNRSLSGRGAQVECALMALERWLDDEINSAHEINRWVQYLFDHGESIALAGVLISVGLKHPALFTDILQPLLGNYALYHWQQNVAVAEPQKIWAIGLFNQPQLLVEDATKWHDQPHRGCLLRDVAVWLMHQHAGTWDYLATRRAVWASEIKAKGKAKIDLEFFLARFDPANYSEKPVENGCVEITMKWPPHLQKIADQSLAETNLWMRAINLAMVARNLLNGQRVLPQEQLPDFVQQLRQLVEWRYPKWEESQEHYRVSSIAGGLAVLIVQHRVWLAQDPAIESWVIQTLRTLQPVLPEHHSPHVGTDHTVESFLGEAAVALLTESGEEWVRHMAFEGVTATTYRATFDTMWRAYQLRARLGETFTELVNVVLLWSALRRAGMRTSGPYADGAALAKQKPALLARFLQGKLKQQVRLPRAECLGRWLIERIERKELTPGQREWRAISRAERAKDKHEISREMPDLDLEVLRRGLGFLQDSLTDSTSATSLDSDLLADLFDLEMATFPDSDTEQGWRRVDGTPYDFDRWILQIVASHIAYANSIEVARRFYQPVLDIGPSAHYWLEEFLRAWVIDGLRLTPDHSGYVCVWKEMIAYVEPLPDWQPGKPGYYCAAEFVAHYLIGLHEDQVRVLGEAQYRTVVSEMAGTLEAWAKRWLRYESLAHWYTNFITTESGKILLPHGILQLASFVDSYRDDDWSRYSLGTLLTKTLSVAWTDLRAAIESKAEIRAAFLKILTALCARLVPEALNLRTKVGDALKVTPLSETV